jgi:hypothetical protein
MVLMTVAGERLKFRTHELVTLAAVLQMLLIDAAEQKWAIGGPVE